MITNSVLKVDSIVAPFGFIPTSNDQIKADGCYVEISGGSLIENLGLRSSIIAVNSTRGRLLISGSTIRNFDYGVYKDLGGSLDIFGSKIFRSTVYNKCNSVKVRKSFFEFGVISEGRANGLYSGNHFKGGLRLVSPQTSNKVTENYFTDSYFEPNLNNKLSDATCNRWKNDIAVDASATSLPISWGSLTQPSGNKWEGNQRPDMNSPVKITNYHKYNDNNHRFTYNFPFEGLSSNIGVSENCQYLPPPSGLGNGGTTGVDNNGNPLVPEDPIDWSVINNQYNQYMNDLVSLEASMTGVSGEALIAIQDNIENLKIAAGQLVNLALQAIDFNTNTSTISLWQSRSGSISTLYQAVLVAITNSQWSTASSFASSQASDDSEVAIDKQDYIAAINYLNNLVNDGTPIALMNEDQLAEFIDLIDDSFGDYTATLRNFLNIQYNIIVTSSDPLQQYSKSGQKIIEHIDKLEVSVSPNPNSGQFTIRFKDSEIKFKDLSVHSLNGEVIYKSKKLQSFVVLPESVRQGIYIVKYKIIGSDQEQINRLIIIK